MASVNTLVQASADVITIVNLKRGDVYKRLIKNYGDTYELKFGVVADVLHNGDEAAITAVEFTSDYSGVKPPELKVFGTSNDLKIFSATPEEVEIHFSDIRKAADAEIDKAKKVVEEKERIARQVTEVTTELIGSGLTTPAITQK